MNSGSIPAEWLPHYTYKDYQKWEGDWELIGGFPYAMSPSPLYKHQLTGSSFIVLVSEKLKKNKISCDCNVVYELDWIINDYTIVRPDAMIICDEKPTDFVRNPPVLVLEIFSPATLIKDRNLKFKLYEENGVRYYIMADPEKKSVEIFLLKNNRFEETASQSFNLTSNCSIELDLKQLWQ